MQSGLTISASFITIKQTSSKFILLLNWPAETRLNGQTLVLEGANGINLSGQEVVVHEKRQLLRTYQELFTAINKSGILPTGVSLSYDPLKNEIVIPFSFQKNLPTLANQQLNLGLDLGDLSLSTNAKTAINAGVNGRMDLVIDFDGPTGREGINLYVDNVELKGNASLEINDLEVAASLGFVGLTAGGAGTGSGVRVAASVATGLDRDPNTVTLGDRRFSFNDLMSGELLNSFYFKLDGDAQAKLKGLKVNGGFGDISIAPNAELSVYVPSLLEVNKGVQTVKQSVSTAFDLNAAIASGQVKKEGIVVVMPDMADLLSLKNLSFEMVLEGIEAGIDFMRESFDDQPFYNTPIPIINRSLSETFTFLDELTNKLQSTASNPAGMIQDVERTIENALGIQDNNTLAADQQKFSIYLKDGALNIHLGWEALFSDKFEFNLDLETIKQLSGNSGAAALDAIDALADLGGGANLTLEAIAKLNFDVGVDLNSLLSGAPKTFLRDYDAATGKGTHAQVGARLLGTNLDLNFKAGPINLGVSNGTVTLDADGNAATKDYAGLLVAIDQKAGAQTDDGRFYIGQEAIKDNFQAKLTGGFDVNLPVRLEIGGADFNLAPITVKTNPVYGDQGLVQLFKHLANAPDKGATEPLKMTFPDIRNQFSILGGDFSLMALINDPSFILDSIDTTVGTLQDVMDSNLAQDIPLIGDKLGEAASFLRDIRQGILGDLRQKLSGNGKAVELIRETLYDVFGPNRLNILLDTNKDTRISIEDVQIGWYDKLGNLMQNWTMGSSVPVGADAIQFDMDLGGRLVGTGFELPLDFSIPGFSFDVDGGLALDLGWKFDFGFGLSLQDSFYLSTNKDASSEIQLGIAAYLDGSPDDPNKITRFTGEGDLLFFKANIQDNNPGGKASGIYSGLSIDLKGDSKGRMAVNRMLSSQPKDLFEVKFGVDAKLDLGVELELDGAKGLPRVAADLELDWSWQMGQKMQAPSFGLRDMRMDLGSFTTDFLTPIAEQVRDALTPMKPMIDALDTKISGLDLIIPSDPTLKGLINQILVIKGKQPIDWSFLTEAKQMLGLVDQIANLKPNEWLPLGSISGLGTKNVQAVQATNVPSNTSVDQFLAQNTRQTSTSSSGFGKTPRSGFQVMPYIKDISNWKNLLTGGDATLFTYELPLLQFKADFDAVLAMIPIGPVSINIGARGNFAATADLGFGYDTKGIRQAISSQNPLDAFDGFFLTDFTIPTKKGEKAREKDEFVLDAYLGLEAALGVGPFEAGLGGGIRARMGVDLADIEKPKLTKDELGFVTGQTWQSDGKIRLSEIITMFNYDPANDGVAGGLKNLANVDAKVDFVANAFVDINLLFTQKRIVDVELFKMTLLELSYDAPKVQPHLGKVENGVLYVNSGSRAGQRKYGDTSDNNETFTFHGQENTVSVQFGDYYQTFTGVSKVVADGGMGDDTFDASRLFGIGVEFTGGEGKDKLMLGTGGGRADGGAGDDTIDASVSWLSQTTDSRFAQFRDSFVGATLIGGEGRDRITGSKANDVIDGGLGADNLAGGEGDDTYLFGDNYGLDRINDSKGIQTFDFSSASQQLTATLSRRGFGITQGAENEVVANLTVNRVILGAGDDLVVVNDFGDRTIYIDDKGGSDSYRMRLGRAQGNGIGVINLNDTAGDFDEVIAEQVMASPVALNQNQLQNGREVLNYTSGLERLTLIGRAGQVNGTSVLDFGGNVMLNNTDNGGITRNGTTDIRVIATKADLQSQINADAIIVETLKDIRVNQTLNAINSGYIDLRTYGDQSSIQLAADLKVSTGNSEDGQGSGWMRLISADGSIRNLNGSEIIGSNSHLMLKAKDAIGTNAAALLTDVATLTAGTSLHGTGDIVIREANSLTLTNLEKTAPVVNAGLTLPNVSETPAWMQQNQWVQQLSGDWRSLITDGNDTAAVSAGNGNISLTLTGADALLKLESGTLANRQSGNITLTADDMDFRSGINQVQGTGSLTLQAHQTAYLYRLGGAAENNAGVDLIDLSTESTPALELSTLDLAALSDGFSQVTIGRLGAGNEMQIGDIFKGDLVRGGTDGVVRQRGENRQQPEFRDTTTLLTSDLHVRGDVRATGETLTVQSDNAIIYRQNNHLVPGAGISAADLRMQISQKMTVSGWLRGEESVTITANQGSSELLVKRSRTEMDNDDFENNFLSHNKTLLQQF